MTITIGRMRSGTLAGAAAVVALVCCGTLQAQLHTHTPDANTIYLYHFNEAAGGGSAANAGSAAFPAISYDGATFAGDGIDQPNVTTLLGATGFTGFGNAANINATTVGFGVDVNGSGTFQMDDGAPISNDRLLDHSSIFGTGNAFTIEALVNLDSITSGNREIIATDSGAANDARGFQFRVSGATTPGNLEFNFVGVNTSAVFAVIPTTGPHAFVANQWFHTAIAYDGTNARFYWTRVDPSFSAANLIGGPVAEGVDVSDDMLLTIGNEGRGIGGSSEGLFGLIDEVRISNVSRGAAEFIFGVPIVAGDVDGDQMADIDDFNIIKMNLFKTGQARNQGDIAGGDGIVDFADYRQWKTAAAPAVAAIANLFSVPEPSSCILLTLGGIFLGSRRRRRESLRWVS